MNWNRSVYRRSFAVLDVPEKNIPTDWLAAFGAPSGDQRVLFVSGDCCCAVHGGNAQ